MGTGAPRHFRTHQQPCYNGYMITYSRQQAERQLIADQALWGQVPVAAGALLWPLEVALLGWGVGWWSGAATVIAVSIASTAVPPRLRVSIYLVDLLERAIRLPTGLCWLLLLWHLWLREPLFPLMGQPLLGAIAVTACLWVLTRLVAFSTRLAARRALARGRA